MLQASLSVRLNMIEPGNGQIATATPVPSPKYKVGTYTGEILLRTRPKTYRKVVMLLANPDWSKRRIAQACKVSPSSVDAVEKRESSTIEARKKTLTSVLVDVATLGAEQMERKIGKASLRDASIATGVSVDKVLALQGQSPVGVQVAVVMPTEQEREERRALHDRLDAIAARLNAAE